jgi:hypothetical protein
MRTNQQLLPLKAALDPASQRASRTSWPPLAERGVTSPRTFAHAKWTRSSVSLASCASFPRSVLLESDVHVHQQRDRIV